MAGVAFATPRPAAPLSHRPSMPILRPRRAPCGAIRVRLQWRARARKQEAYSPSRGRFCPRHNAKESCDDVGSSSAVCVPCAHSGFALSVSPLFCAWSLRQLAGATFGAVAYMLSPGSIRIESPAAFKPDRRLTIDDDGLPTSGMR
ncbi:hypothetical protein LY78DRAFT_126599 [Colletotrichum sublineola]|nr:hypothetical protein LY78DRAFT_126599 [Colletotrichum sublineola]